MRCANCGAERSDTAEKCPKCGSVVKGNPSTDTQPAAKADPKTEDRLDPAEIARRAKFDYAYAKREPCTKHVDVLQKLMEKSLKGRSEQKELIQSAAELIYKEFRLKDVTIGLWDPHTKLYNYEVMAGMQANIWTAMKRLQYTPEQFNDPVRYKGTMLGEQTKLFLAEDEPFAEGEEDTVDRNEYLKSKRRAPDLAVEGDYLDTYIYGPGRELIGWIEYGGTWGGRLPDVATIRWVELVASFLGFALAANSAPRKSPGKQV